MRLYVFTVWPLASEVIQPAKSVERIDPKLSGEKICREQESKDYGCLIGLLVQNVPKTGGFTFAGTRCFTYIIPKFPALM
jgi:hypothetical protein